MSEKIGDDDSVYTADASPNSENSSSKSRRYLEGGPYGDGPSKSQYKDSVVFILQSNQESTDTTECSDAESELYSLRNEYLQKLKIIRRKLETIHPFTLCYNELEPESKTNLLEMEYNPPKKKSCIRVKTPKLSSESNIPYHTKVSLHDNLFRNKTETSEEADVEKTLGQKFLENFTMTREVQCYEDDLKSVVGSSFKGSIETKNTDNANSVSVKKNTDNSLNINLFPKVIINYDQSRLMQPSTSSSNSSRSYKLNSKDVEDKVRVSLPNYVEETSGECCSPVTSTTVVESAKAKNKVKKIKIKRKNSILQYVTYRKENDRAKTTPIKIKTLVPFGPVILHDYEKNQNIDSRFYLVDSTSQSDHNLTADVYSARAGSKDSSNKNIENKSSFCGRLRCCFSRFFSFFSRKRREDN